MAAVMLRSELVAAWRDRAELLRRHGAIEAAATTETLADELEVAIPVENDELLTLAQAAETSGYSEDHLGREIREGRLPNAGRSGAPRIRRADLPRKLPGRRTLIAGGRLKYDADADAEFLLAGRLQQNGGAHGK